MKSKESLKNLKALSGVEQKEKGRTISEELMKLRMRVASGQPEQGNRITLLRKEFARVSTVIVQKAKAA